MIRLRVFLVALTTLVAATAGSISISKAGWMSYAIDDRGAVGHGLSPDRTTAQNFALSYCGNANCRIVETINAKCVALAESRHNGYWIGIGAASNLGGAKGHAINWCAKSAPASTCRLRHSYCQ